MCFNRLSLEVAPWCLQWHKLLEITNKRPRRNIQHHPSKKHPNPSKTALNTMVKQQKRCQMVLHHTSETQFKHFKSFHRHGSFRKLQKKKTGGRPADLLRLDVFFLNACDGWRKDVWLEAMVRVCLKCDLHAWWMSLYARTVVEVYCAFVSFDTFSNLNLIFVHLLTPCTLQLGYTC